MGHTKVKRLVKARVGAEFGRRKMAEGKHSTLQIYFDVLTLRVFFVMTRLKIR